MTAMKWCEGRLLAFDLESTSADPEHARIVQYAVAWVGGRTLASHQETVVDPGVEVPEEAAAIHGLTTDMVRAQGQDAAAAVGWLVEVFALARRQGRPVVGHNVVYDLTVLDREVRRHLNPDGLEVAVGGPVRPVVDTMVLSKHVDPYRRRVSADQGAHVLKTCVQQLIPAEWGIAWSDEDAHGALYDCLMAARVAVAAARKHPEIGDVDAEALHEAQVGWKADQSASLQTYLRSPKAGERQDPDAVVAGDWPIIPAAGVVA